MPKRIEEVLFRLPDPNQLTFDTLPEYEVERFGREGLIEEVSDAVDEGS